MQLAVNAPMVELVDTQDLKSCDLTVVRVQVPFGVQAKSSLSEMRGFFVLYKMLFYVYILYSVKIDRYYVGYSENPILRLEERHNKGKVKATKGGVPYRLIKHKVFSTEIEAIREERRIKKMKSRKYIEQIIAGNW